MYDYSVFEDNGGGLSLIVFETETGKNVYYHDGYEHNPGQLSEDLKALRETDSISGWDGNNLELFSEYISLGRLIAHSGWGEESLDFEAMGIAGKIEFGSND